MISVIKSAPRGSAGLPTLTKSAIPADLRVLSAAIHVPDKRSRILDVVVERRLVNLGTGNLEWGGSGKGLRKGRSVYE